MQSWWRFSTKRCCTTTDVVVELFDQCLWRCHVDAKQELEEFRRATARSTNETLRLFRELGRVLLDPRVEDAEVRSASFARVPEGVLREAIHESQGLIRPRPDDAIDFLAKRYAYLRQFVPSFLQTLTLRAQGPDDSVLRAVEVIRGLDGSPTRRAVPKNAPLTFVSQAWRPYLREAGGGLSRRYYELCTLWHLRSALRSGSIWIEQSRRYADPDTYLIPPAQWPGCRPEVLRQTGAHGDGRRRLEERDAELEACMARVEKLLARKDSPVQIEDGTLTLSPLEADRRPDSAEALADLIAGPPAASGTERLAARSRCLDALLRSLCPCGRRRGAAVRSVAASLCQHPGARLQFRPGTNGAKH